MSYFSPFLASFGGGNPFASPAGGMPNSTMLNMLQGGLPGSLGGQGAAPQIMMPNSPPANHAVPPGPVPALQQPPNTLQSMGGLPGLSGLANMMKGGTGSGLFGANGLFGLSGAGMPFDTAADSGAAGSGFFGSLFGSPLLSGSGIGAGGAVAPEILSGAAAQGIPEYLALAAAF